MDDLTLFEAPSEHVTLPGIEQREESRAELLRADWRRRQRKCRARRQMAKNAQHVALAKQTGGIEQSEPIPRVDFENMTDAQIARWMSARTRLWGAFLLGGSLAARVFETVAPESLDYPENIIFRVARDIWREGGQVSRATVQAELRRRHLLVPGGVAWLDQVLQSPLIPRQFEADMVDEDSEILKQA